VLIEGGQLRRVQPAEGYPFNLGQMCVKGLATPEIVYHPDRLLSPLKRAGERGSGKWVRLDWDTALSEIVARITSIRQESGAESVALGQGTGRHHYMHVVRFANQLGTPNWYEPGLANCFIPRVSLSNLTYGALPVADYYGSVNPATILFWGHNPLVSGPDGELSFPVARALDRGAFGIAVDPRRSETARRCALWLPVRPGSDLALALAMIHTIIYDGIYDKPFVDQWTVGFEELKRHVVGYTPAWAEPITGIPAEDIRAAAVRYATAKPAVLEWGVAIEQHPDCMHTVRALAILRGLTGNLDVPGADVFGMHMLRSYPTLRHLLPYAMVRKRIGGQRFALLGGARAYLPSAHIPGLFRAMRAGDPYRVRALLIFGNNPLVSVANSRFVREALLKLDLLVVTDLFMTPSAALADYVLPAACWPEINQIIELPFVAENAVFANRKLLQVGDCRQDEEIMIDLARRMGLPDAERSLEDILDSRLEPLGLTFQDLKARFQVCAKQEYRRWEKKGFRTPSGKVELYSRSLERLGYAALPTYGGTGPQDAGDTAGPGQYPYLLVTGARRREFFHSEHRQVPSLRQRRPHPVAEFHPAIAAAHGIGDGDWVCVRTAQGQVRMQASVTEDIRRDVVSIDHGWWFPERQAPEFGVWESNANVLTSGAPPYDAAFGSYQLRGIPCAIEKAPSE